MKYKIKIELEQFLSDFNRADKLSEDIRVLLRAVAGNNEFSQATLRYGGREVGILEVLPAWYRSGV